MIPHWRDMWINTHGETRMILLWERENRTTQPLVSIGMPVFSLGFSILLAQPFLPALSIKGFFLIHKCKPGVWTNTASSGPMLKLHFIDYIFRTINEPQNSSSKNIFWGTSSSTVFQFIWKYPSCRSFSLRVRRWKIWTTQSMSALMSLSGKNFWTEKRTKKTQCRKSNQWCNFLLLSRISSKKKASFAF